jgi:Tol biopolymer transport system component
MAWSPDGRTLAAGMVPEGCCDEYLDVAVFVMSAGGQDVRPLFQCPRGSGCAKGQPRALAWSRDSKQIALATNQELYVIPLDGGAPDLVCTCGPLGATFLPDGRLAYATDDALQGLGATGGEVKAIDLSSGETSTVMTAKNLTEAAWSPDGRYLVIDTGDNHLSLIDTYAPTPWTAETVSAHGIGPTWSSNGDRFAFSGQSGHDVKTFRMQLWIGAPGQPARLLHQFDNNNGWSPPVWSPDGSTVGTYNDNAIWLFDVVSGELVDKVDVSARGAAWQQAPGTGR